MVINLNFEDYPREFGEALAMIHDRNGGCFIDADYSDFSDRCKLERDRYLLTGKCLDQTTVMMMMAIGEPSPPILQREIDAYMLELDRRHIEREHQRKEDQK